MPINVVQVFQDLNERLVLKYQIDERVRFTLALLYLRIKVPRPRRPSYSASLDSARLPNSLSPKTQSNHCSQPGLQLSINKN